MFRIMVLNLGATSTKVAYYEDEALLSSKNIAHGQGGIGAVDTPGKQLAYRKKLVLDWLDEIGQSMDTVDAFAMRAGVLKRSMPVGTFAVNKVLRDELLARYDPDGHIIHPGLLTIPLMDELCEGREIPTYITDPATVDEFTPEARIAGHPDFFRKPVFHALNQREVGRRIASEKLGKKYEECDLVIAHMGGGISVAAHKHGVIVDSNNATKGEGPFSPSRSGTLPMEQIIEACYSGKYSQSDAINLIMPQGGVKAYLGTDDMRKVEQMISEGNTQAELVFKAMGYQTAKEIGAYVAVLYGKADAIILTGGIAHSARMAELIGQRVSTFAPFYVYPGEFEQEALINGALRVLRGQEKPRVYGEK